MTHPAYPAARVAALRVHPHYAQHLAETELLPDTETIEAMIDVAFWASLRREETYTPRVSLAFVPPAHVDLPLVFEQPIPLASQPLTRMGPAVERPGIHLCVCRRNGDLLVWGAARSLPPFCFVLEVVAPGLLVIKHGRGDESSKFVNVAVLQGDEVKVIDQHAAAGQDCPELLTLLLGLQSDVDSPDSVNVLIQLAVSMRAHGRGGSLLVVPALVAPAAGHLWRESILHPITYSVAPPFRALVDLMREDPGERSRRRWQESLRRVVDGIAGLTAVDGATIITDQYELLAFGAKIVRRPGWPQVGGVIVTEPIEGTAAAVAEPGQLGGTRHLSAAQFAHDQRDAIALVASQDGRFTVFGWSPCEEMVHAHRIETLLL
ncbi:MAG: putative sensor domain DACNV-containing protein [Bryobacteraceae bacterium]|jgi:hypothetical protein